MYRDGTDTNLLCKFVVKKCDKQKQGLTVLLVCERCTSVYTS